MAGTVNRKEGHDLPDTIGGAVHGPCCRRQSGVGNNTGPTSARQVRFSAWGHGRTTERIKQACTAEVKYSYAFFDRLPEVGWDSLYVEYLSRVQQTKSTLEYYRTLQEMTAYLRDAHTGVNLPPELYSETSYRPAIRPRLIEDQALVVEVNSDAEASTDASLHPGVEILRVDGIPVRVYAASHLLPYAGVSTPQARDVYVYDYKLLLGRKGSECELELRGDVGPPYVVRLPRQVPVMVRPDSEPHLS